MISNKPSDTDKISLHQKVFIKGTQVLPKLMKNYSRNKIKTLLLTSLEKKENFSLDNNTDLIIVSPKVPLSTKKEEERMIGSLFIEEKPTNFDFEKNKITNSFFLNRLSYSQSGKAIVQIGLVNHKTPVNLALWPRQKNFRYKQGVLTGDQIENTRRLNIEVLIVGLLSAKASESFIITNTKKENILLCQTNKTLSERNEKKFDSQVYSNQLFFDENEVICLPMPKVNNKYGMVGLSVGPKDQQLRTTKEAKEKKYEKIDQLLRKNKKSKRVLTRWLLSSMSNSVGLGSPNQKTTSFSTKGAYHQSQNDSNEQQKRLMPNSNSVFGLEVEELSRVTLVTAFLVNTCNFYSKQILGRQLNKFVSNLNSLEIYEKEKLAFLEELNLRIENRFPFRSLSKSKTYEQKAFSNASRAYWQDKISRELGFNNGNFTDWYRIYIADPEEKASNIEWVAPDEYYQNHPIKMFSNRSSLSSFLNGSELNPKEQQLTSLKSLFMASDKNPSVPFLPLVDFSSKNHGKERKEGEQNKNKIYDFYRLVQRTNCEPSPKKLKVNNQNSNLLTYSSIDKTRKGWNKFYPKKSNKTALNQPICWNNLDQLDQDFLYHSILIRCFNDAFCLIDENREMIDLIADYLLRFELLRQPKLLKITDF